MKIGKPQSEINFAKEEECILEFWNAHQIFRKSIENRSEDDLWSFYDGPPFATGLPHYGHLLPGTIKDVFPRYWTMRGKRVERRFGWDCHGLPVEFEIEKKLNLKGRADILDFGVGKFNEECRSIVLRYTQQWRDTIGRMGRWVDFDNDYKTMDLSYMESVWHVFQQLWENGLIYEDKKVLPYSTRVTSPLSNFEANLNYQNVQDPAVYVLFKEAAQDRWFLVWTTTPWTLPSNVALAVNQEIAYVEVSLDAKRVVLAEALLDSILKRKKLQRDDVKILNRFTGASLVGTAYQQIIPPFHRDQTHLEDFHIFAADFVSADAGTGIVHIAPAFGEDDFQLGKENNLSILDHLDEQGHFLEDSPHFAGLYFKDADKPITAWLRDKDQLFFQETIQHAYPFCYRSDTPLIYRAISTWFVKVEAIKEKLCDNNDLVHWVPQHLKKGRFGKWLENARDWAISRNRFWGNPIPVWRNDETGETLCVGSKEELEKLSGTSLSDLHKHYVDDIEITSPKTGDTLKRVPQVLDCWFESGAMPYAQHHYPFSMNEAELQKRFPADFIAEGLDQTRGWFYTLMILSTALKNKPAYKNVVVNGIVLASDGRKMSKRLNNYPDPLKIVDEFGADALRVYLLQSGAVRGEDIRFEAAGVQEMVRRLLIPFWNAYTFFATYAHIDRWDTDDAADLNVNHPMDQWILIKLNRLKADLEKNLEAFDLSKAVIPIFQFIDQLNNWYIRRSRRRFWKSENDQEKREAFSTLYRVLTEFSRLLAPFTPFISEKIFKALVGSEKLSVHLEGYPRPSGFSAEMNDLEEEIDFSRQAVGLGRELREKIRIKVRQPLSKLYIGVLPGKKRVRSQMVLDTISEELNVKDIAFVDFSEMATWQVKPNFKKLGKILGPNLKAFQGWCKTLPEASVLTLLEGQNVSTQWGTFSAEDFEILLQAKADFNFECHSLGDLVIAFDTTITESLENEGLAREIISRVQKMRKERDFNVEDRILFKVECPDPKMQKVFSVFKNEIENETLSRIQIDSPALFGSDYSTENIEGYELKIRLECK